jgi:hypothetical protein
MPRFHRIRYTAVFASALLALGGSATLHADLRWTASGRAGWAENVSRSSFPQNWKDSAILESTLEATYPRAFARNWLLLASAHADIFTVRDFALNNTLALGPRLDLQRKFGLGPYAPTLRSRLGLTYRDARLRGATGWTTDAGLQFSQRFSPAFRVFVGYDWSQHAAPAPTFDVRHRIATGKLTWEFTDRWQLSAAFSRLDGQLVAEASFAVFNRYLAGDFGPLVAQSYNARPFLITDSYGPRWYSYRIDGHAETSTLALAYALSDHTTLDLRLESTRVVNEAFVRYKSDTSSVGLTHRF